MTNFYPCVTTEKLGNCLKKDFPVYLGTATILALD